MRIIRRIADAVWFFIKIIWVSAVSLSVIGGLNSDLPGLYETMSAHGLPALAMAVVDFFWALIYHEPVASVACLGLIGFAWYVIVTRPAASQKNEFDDARSRARVQEGGTGRKKPRGRKR